MKHIYIRWIRIRMYLFLWARFSRFSANYAIVPVWLSYSMSRIYTKMMPVDQRITDRLVQKMI